MKRGNWRLSTTQYSTYHSGNHIRVKTTPTRGGGKVLNMVIGSFPPLSTLPTTQETATLENQGCSDNIWVCINTAAYLLQPQRSTVLWRRFGLFVLLQIYPVQAQTLIHFKRSSKNQRLPPQHLVLRCYHVEAVRKNNDDLQSPT